MQMMHSCNLMFTATPLHMLCILQAVTAATLLLILTEFRHMGFAGQHPAGRSCQLRGQHVGFQAQ